VYTENLLTGPTVTIQDAAPTTKPLQPLSAATAILKKVIEQMEGGDHDRRRRLAAGPARQVIGRSIPSRRSFSD
jgi:hypothetical protein